MLYLLYYNNSTKCITTPSTHPDRERFLELLLAAVIAGLLITAY